MPTSSSLGATAPAPAPEPIRLSPLAPRTVKPPARAWWWGVLAVVILAGLVAWWQRQAFSSRQPAAAVPAFRTVRAWTGSLERSLRLAGVTAADKFALLLAPQMRGTRGHGPHDFTLVLQQVVPAGSYVRKGDLVAEFDRQYMLVRLEDYKAMVDQHERNVTRLKAYRAVVRAAHDQLVIKAKGQSEKAALDLKKIPILSDIKAQKARLDYEEAQARYRQLNDETQYVMISESSAVLNSELDLRVSRMEFDRAQRNADRMVVRAPIDGMTVMMTTHRGSDHAQIQQGDQVGSGQPYMRIVDLRNMVVNATVNQVDAQFVHLGMAARVRFDAYPGLELPARVTSVGAFAQSAGWRGSYVRSILVRLKLERTDPKVIPDLSVSADLSMGHTDNATIVPREAVFGGAGEEGQFAFVRDADGDWEKRPLEIVMTNETAVAVRSGVNPGDVLAAEWPAASPERAEGGTPK